MLRGLFFVHFNFRNFTINVAQYIYTQTATTDHQAVEFKY